MSSIGWLETSIQINTPCDWRDVPHANKMWGTWDAHRQLGLWQPKKPEIFSQLLWGLHGGLFCCPRVLRELFSWFVPAGLGSPVISVCSWCGVECTTGLCRDYKADFHHVLNCILDVYFALALCPYPSHSVLWNCCLTICRMRLSSALRWWLPQGSEEMGHMKVLSFPLLWNRIVMPAVGITQHFLQLSLTRSQGLSPLASVPQCCSRNSVLIAAAIDCYYLMIVVTRLRIDFSVSVHVGQMLSHLATFPIWQWHSLYSFIYLFIVCLCVCLHGCLCRSLCRSLWWLEEGTRFPGTKGCEPF